MFLTNLFTVILFLHASFADKYTLPVFMIDQDSVMTHVQIEPNPFRKLGASSFADIIHDTIKRTESVILFIEETFSTEDISMKDALGTPFTYLRNGLFDRKVKYFPAVSEPYKLISQVFQPHQYNVFHLRGRSKLQLIDNNYKYLYIYFQDGANETRADVLRRHDGIIRDVISNIRDLKTGPVAGFYTGKINPVVIQKSEVVMVKPRPVMRDMGIMIVSSGAMFRFTGVYAATPSRRSMFNQLPMVAEETFTRRSMSTKMAYTDFELEFNFSFKDEGWIIDSVGLLEAGEEVGRTEMGVGAPWNWSYVCGEPLVIVNTRDGSSVTISQYQIQPRLLEYRRDGLYPIRMTKDSKTVSGPGRESEDGPVCFGKSINCGPYFNTNILAGLMVTALCLSITGYGVMGMMDLRANDRYDDPQGKQLVHNI